MNQSRGVGVPGITFLLCFLVNIFDGFDLQAIAFAAPAIASDWGLGPEVMGIIFSATPIGMAIGAIVFGSLGDWWGRKRALLASVTLISVGSILTALSTEPQMLFVTRLATGLGIGGALPNLTVIIAEVAPEGRRNIWISVLHIGYSVGAVAGAWLAALWIPLFNWQGIFWFGGIAPALLLPFLAGFLPDIRPRTGTTSDRESGRTTQAAPLRLLLTAPNLGKTVRIASAFFFTWLTVYFLMSWIPSILVRVGYPLDKALYATMVFNLASLFGTLAIGFVTTLWANHRSIICFILIGTLGTAVLAFASSTAVALMLLAVIGFFVLGGLIGLYVLTTWAFPAQCRTSGLGVALGVGRMGAIIGPAAGGLLISFGWPETLYFPCFAALLALAALSLVGMKLEFVEPANRA